MQTPGIVDAILDRRQPEGMTLPRLMKAFPVEWQRQNHAALPLGA